MVVVTGVADLELKLRMQKVLWALSYYTRVGVKLTGREVTRAGARRAASLELTDIDVLGIKVEADFSFDRVVVDCTTRSQLSPINRSFWLRGVMTYFGATRAYMVIGREVPTPHRLIASKLGITILDDETLRRFEQVLSLSPSPNRLGDLPTYTYLDGNLRGLAEGLRPLMDFRDHEFWMNDSGRNILRSISLVHRFRATLKAEQKFHRALVFDVFTLFCLSLTDMCSVLFRMHPTDFHGAVRLFLFGGTTGLSTREAFLRDLQTLVEKLTGSQRVSLPKNVLQQFRLEPPYFDRLVERVVRLVNRPHDAKDVLRYLQVMLLFDVLYQEDGISAAFGDSRSEVTQKFVRDLADFFIDATGIDPLILRGVDSFVDERKPATSATGVQAQDQRGTEGLDGGTAETHGNLRPSRSKEQADLFGSVISDDVRDEEKA